MSGVEDVEGACTGCGVIHGELPPSGQKLCRELARLRRVAKPPLQASPKVRRRKTELEGLISELWRLEVEAGHAPDYDKPQLSSTQPDPPWGGEWEVMFFMPEHSFSSKNMSTVLIPAGWEPFGIAPYGLVCRRRIR